MNHTDLSQKQIHHWQVQMQVCQVGLRRCEVGYNSAGFSTMPQRYVIQRSDIRAGNPPRVRLSINVETPAGAHLSRCSCRVLALFSQQQLQSVPDDSTISRYKPINHGTTRLRELPIGRIVGLRAIRPKNDHSTR